MDETKTALSNSVNKSETTNEISFGLFFFCASMIIVASVVFPFLMI